MSTKALQVLSITTVVATLALVSGVRIQAADLSNGVQIYAEYCEHCHGSGGVGMAGMGELRPWDQLMKPDADLFNSIRDGVSVMPGFDGLLYTEEMMDVIAYMRTFK